MGIPLSKLAVALLCRMSWNRMTGSGAAFAALANQWETRSG